MGVFFIRFVTFTSTLVYSVVWNQSHILSEHSYGIPNAVTVVLWRGIHIFVVVLGTKYVIAIFPVLRFCI